MRPIGLLVALVVVVVGVMARGVAAQERSPNIIFIYTDDQRWDCLSIAGHPFLKTPNIDRIGHEGAYFRNAFVTTPLCSPARASFLTGQYAHTHGIVGNAPSIDPISFKLDSYPRHLQRAGYETAIVGKWHMGTNDAPRPGFDQWISFRGQGRYFDQTFNINGEMVPTTGYITDVITDLAIEFINKDRGDKPFAMIVGHKAVHGPFTPAPRHEHLFTDEELPVRPGVHDDLKGKPALTREVADPPEGHPAYGVSEQLIRNQLRGLVAVDEGVGRILKALEETGQLDNTLIIYTSDNGFFWNEHRLGDKRAAYEESIRVPMVMRYPKLIRPGTVIDQMVLDIDIAPTILEVAQAKSTPQMHGRSLVSLLKDQSSEWRATALFEYFLEPRYANIETWQAVRTEQWKYIHYPNLDGMDELYNLENDPYEMKNVIGDPGAADALSMLQAELKRMLEETQ